MLLEKEEINFSKKGGETILLYKNAMKKTSQVLVLAMLLMVFMPIISFAASVGISNVTYDKTNGKVTATVYSDVYNSVYGSVYLSVYSNDGPTDVLATVYKSVYETRTVDEVTYYDFTFDVSVVAGVYDSVYLQASYNSVGSSVYKATYTAPVNPTPGGGGDGGGTVTPSLESISFDPTSYSLTVGGSVTATVYANYSDGNKINVTALAGLVSSSPSVASVNQTTGAVSAFTAGGTVLTATYGALTETANVTVTSGSGTGGGGGGGGGGGVATTTPTTVEPGADGKVDSKALTDAFKGSDNPQVKVKDVASLPASALIEAAKKAGTSLTISSENGTYVLPLSLLKLDDLAKSLGIAVADLNIKVSITKVSGTTATAVADGVKAIGGTSLTDAIDFKVTAEGKDGKSVEINGFGNTYVSRSVTIGKAVDMKKVTGVLYNEVTKKFSFVPATFETKDGKTVATLKRNGNSIYTVVEINKNFTDIASHWSKDDVNLLANKLVIDGATDTTFAPDRNISRAEFAALVVRSLGLNTDATSATFTDVKSSDWFAGAVAAAAGAKIINGYEDGSFKANAQITREELASMVVRALTFAGVKSDLSATQQATLLGKFTDASQIDWADKEIAVAVDAGIINGLTNTTIGSSKQATRAEAATMLKRFLTKAGFIN